MASLAELPAAAADALRNQVAGLATCEPYAGQFGGSEPKRASFRAPAVFVAMAEARASDPGTGQLDLRAACVAFCVWRHARSGAERSASGAALAEAVALAVRGNQWGLAGVGPARVERIENLHAPALAAAGLALWAVRWSQRVVVGQSVWEGDGVAPVDVFAGFDPRVGAIHLGDYEQVAP